MTLRGWIIVHQNRLSAWIDRPDRGIRAVALILPKVAVGVALFAWFQITNLAAQLRWPFAAAIKRLRPAGDRAVSAAPNDRAGIAALVTGTPLLLLEFSAEWCGPCVLMEHILEQFATARRDLVICTVDVSVRTALARAYGVKMAPTIIAFREGQELARHSGALSYEELGEWVESLPSSGTAEGKSRDGAA